MRRLFAGFFLGLFAVMMLLPGLAGAAPKQRVYVIHMDNWQEIDPGLAQITKRIFAEAEAYAKEIRDPSAVAIAVVLDTPGGLVVSALEIKDLLLNTPLKTIAYVEGGAISAGALIATAAEKLYMHSGSTIGAAEPREAGTNKPADYKALSVVAGTFESAAIARKRDPNIARAMVDKSTPIPNQKGELLTLHFRDAIDKKYADGEATSLENALQQAGITDFELIDPEPTFSEQVGRFLTEPLVATLLLIVGVIAIGIEFMKPGLTLPGLVGIVSLGLFFLGNSLVGTAGWVELSLALIGFVLLIIEAFMPGFGIFGIGGVAAVGASIFFAVPSQELAWRYLMWTTLAFMVVLGGILRTIGRTGLGKSLTLGDSAKGWNPGRNELGLMVGQEGKTVTVLRPAGTAEFGEQRIDVVAEGEWIQPGLRVKIIRVEGTRVVVRPLGE